MNGQANAERPNEGGAEYLKVDQDEKDFISVWWSGDIQFRGERIGPNILFFEGMNKQRQYQCIGVLEGDQLRLEYRAIALHKAGIISAGVSCKGQIPRGANPRRQPHRPTSDGVLTVRGSVPLKPASQEW